MTRPLQRPNLTRGALTLCACLLMAATARAQSPAVMTPPRVADVFITVLKDECRLLETGIGVGEEEMQANQRRGMVMVSGSSRQEERDVYRCSIEVSQEPLKSAISQCALSGFDATSTDPMWFKGDVRRITRSCSARRLANGNFYFSATGIASDSCSWSCTLR